MFKRIVVTGSLAYDHIMSMPGSFSDHIMPDKIHILNVSFIMQTFTKEFGGTAGNISYSLGLLGVPTLIVASAGYDFQDYSKHLGTITNLDVTGIRVFKDIPTAQGFVTTDKNDNQIWGFYEGAMKKNRAISLKNLLKDGDFVVISPNDPVATIKFVKESVQHNIPYLFDPAFNIPHLTKEDLEFSAENASIVIGNDYEIELIKRRLDLRNLPQTNQIWITTLGSRGSIIRMGKKEWKIPPAKPKSVIDPTGAGDAYRAGFLSGFVRDLPLWACGRLGSLTAAYTVEKHGTQTHRFGVKEFKDRFKVNFGADSIEGGLPI
ncbi:MAG: PfkB family carbohydrate kinase [Dehalococcoidia bacterium]|jgi:adenosine kinase